MPEKTGTILDFRGHVQDSDGEAFNPNWSDAEHESGVAYICPWEDPHAGFPEHSRRCARALDNTGMPVHLRSLDPSTQFRMTFEVGGSDVMDLRNQYEDLLTKSIKSNLVEIYQIVPDDVLLQRLTTHRFIDPAQLALYNRFRIFSCVFERDRVSKHAVRAFNRVGAVWVANTKDKAMLERCGVKRVAVVPIPFFDDDPMLKLRGQKRAPGVVRFYHIGKWEHRKAHHEMFGAFLLAFKPGEAKLYFKTSTKAPDFGDYPSSPEESVHRWSEDKRVIANGWTVELANEDIHLIKRRIPPSQIVQLHKLGDIYLSLSRGEGFDMPAYDAKLAGNMLVYTPSGGPDMYASGAGEQADQRVPMKGSVPCHPFYKWGDAEYGDWNIDVAAQALWDARKRTMSGWSSGDLSYLDYLSAKSVGQMMRDNIAQVLEDGKRYLEERTSAADE